MKYNDYISSLNPRDELMDKTRKSVNAAVIEQNKIHTRRLNLILSSAACFIVLAASVLTINGLNRSAPLTPNNNSNTVSSKTISTTKTTKTTKTIIINTDNDSQKSMPQRILINGYGYRQVCDNNKKAGWGEDNGNVVIEENDIGKKICTIKAENLLDDESLEEMATMSESKAKSNSFFGAKAYKYNKCKNGTVLIVKTKDEYYLFTLQNFTDKVTIKEVYNLFSADGKNPVNEIKVVKSDKHSSFNDKLIKTVKKDKTKKIISLLNEINKAIEEEEVFDKYSNDIESEDLYHIEILFEDGTSFKLLLYRHFVQFGGLSSPNHNNHFEISEKEYNDIFNEIVN